MTIIKVSQKNLSFKICNKTREKYKRNPKKMAVMLKLVKNDEKRNMQMTKGRIERRGNKGILGRGEYGIGRKEWGMRKRCRREQGIRKEEGKE
jgi:hypothetical protein